MDKTTEHQASRCIQIGLLCVQNNHEKRPDMEAVMEMLRSESHLPIPSFPAFFEGTLIVASLLYCLLLDVYILNYELKIKDCNRPHANTS